MILKGNFDELIKILFLLFGYLGLKLQEIEFQEVFIKKASI